MSGLLVMPTLMRPLRVWYDVDVVSTSQPQPHMPPCIKYAQLLEELIKMAKHHPDKFNKNLIIEVDGEEYITRDAIRINSDGCPVIVVQTIEDSD